MCESASTKLYNNRKFCEYKVGHLQLAQVVESKTYKGLW